MSKDFEDPSDFKNFIDFDEVRQRAERNLLIKENYFVTARRYSKFLQKKQKMMEAIAELEKEYNILTSRASALAKKKNANDFQVESNHLFVLLKIFRESFKKLFPSGEYEDQLNEMENFFKENLDPKKQVEANISYEIVEEGKKAESSPLLLSNKLESMAPSQEHSFYEKNINILVLKAKYFAFLEALEKNCPASVDDITPESTEKILKSMFDFYISLKITLRPEDYAQVQEDNSFKVLEKFINENKETIASASIKEKHRTTKHGDEKTFSQREKEISRKRNIAYAKIFLFAVLAVVTIPTIIIYVISMLRIDRIAEKVNRKQKKERFAETMKLLGDAKGDTIQSKQKLQEALNTIKHDVHTLKTDFQNEITSTKPRPR